MGVDQDKEDRKWEEGVSDICGDLLVFPSQIQEYYDGLVRVTNSEDVEGEK